MNACLRCAAALSILALAGCTPAEDDSNAFRVLLLGDASRAAAREKLAEGGGDGVRFVTPPPSSDVMEVADLARSADLVLVVNDATQGPTPIIREHILVARQVQIPSLGLLISKTDEFVDATDGDRELLDLEELELRELLNQYHAAAGAVRRFYDSDALDAAAGPGALHRAVAEGSYPRRSPAATGTVTGTVLRSEIYLLTAAEAEEVQAIASGDTLSFWIDGERMEGVADSSGTIQPGDNATLVIRLSEALTSAPGTRFILARNGHLIGVGTVAGID
jgi:translation elongation factor EF-Tu-like GTPase